MVSWVKVLFVWPIHPPCIHPDGRSWCLTASPDVGVASGCIYFHRTGTENSSLSHVLHTIWKSKVELFVHRMKWKGCFVIVQHKKIVLYQRNRSVVITTAEQTVLQCDASDRDGANVSSRHKTTKPHEKKILTKLLQIQTWGVWQNQKVKHTEIESPHWKILPWTFMTSWILC